MPVYESIVAAVGHTPLVKLNRLAEGVAADVFLKLEYLNPGGSVKDRAARSMIEAAEASGDLQPGGTIVEGTSGNTGIGLAQAAAQRGYRLVAVLPDKVSAEKLDILRAYGAELVITGSGLPRDHPEHVASIAERLSREIPRAWLANQYDNPANPEAHFATTGPEIWADTEGRVTHFVAGIGTGGTISGTGAYLKQVSGGRVEVIGADPATSVYNGGDGSPFFVEAAGHYLHPDSVDDPWPQSYHRDIVDRIEAIPDRESINTLRGLARREGILIGGSGGLAIAAGLRVARNLGSDHSVVILVPDSGRAYLSKYHSLTWLRQLGFLDDDRPGLVGQQFTVHSRRPVTATSRTTLARARELLRGAPADQSFLPIVLDRPGTVWATALSEIIGAVGIVDLAATTAGPDSEIGEIAGPPPPSIGTGETLDEAIARLAGAAAEHAVVLRDGRLAGVTSLDELIGRRGSLSVLSPPPMREVAEVVAS